jgi:hypothetical protein
MPNFDGTGPLRRGRIIGRGRGACTTCVKGNGGRTNPEEPSFDGDKRAGCREEE